MKFHQVDEIFCRVLRKMAQEISCYHYLWEHKENKWSSRRLEKGKQNYFFKKEEKGYSNLASVDEKYISIKIWKTKRCLLSANKSCHNKQISFNRVPHLISMLEIIGISDTAWYYFLKLPRKLQWRKICCKVSVEMVRKLYSDVIHCLQ